MNSAVIKRGNEKLESKIETSNWDSEELHICYVITIEGTGNKLPRKESRMVTHLTLVQLVYGPEKALIL